MTAAVCCTTSKLSLKQLGIAALELNVISGCCSGFKSDGFAHYKGNRFGLGFLDCLADQRCGARFVNHLVRQFVH